MTCCESSRTHRHGDKDVGALPSELGSRQCRTIASATRGRAAQIMRNSGSGRNDTLTSFWCEAESSLKMRCSTPCCVVNITPFGCRSCLRCNDGSKVVGRIARERASNGASPISGSSPAAWQHQLRHGDGVRGFDRVHDDDPLQGVWPDSEIFSVGSS